VVSRIIEAEAVAISNIPITDDFGKALNLIHKVHRKKSKLVVSGAGKSGHVALSIAASFSATGTPSVFLHPYDAQHGDSGIVQPNDVLLLVSNSGKTKETIQLCKLVKKLNYQIGIIVITGNPDSELGKLADVVISTGSPEEVCPLKLAPTSSTTAMKVIGDVLLVLMMKKIKFTSSDYAKRHYGGQLGLESRKRRSR